jgi:putative Mg2+ transporter-C (MgtC) family protein
MGGWWQDVAAGAWQDIAELPDARQLAQLLVRLMVAATLGGLLGYEREATGKSAGVRTHMLVAIGSALFVLVPWQMRWTSADMSRVVQGIIAGVGFLGAGTILKKEDLRSVIGLTTAAGIWLTAAIGVAAGTGRLAAAAAATALTLLILLLIPHVASRRHEEPTSPQAPTCDRS